MSVPITKATLIAAYELIRTTPPFLGWKLPDAGEIDFVVTRDRNRCGDCDEDTIRISSHLHGTVESVLLTMRHEMVHLYQKLHKRETSNTEHNSDFRQLARKVCDKHKLDAKMF